MAAIGLAKAPTVPGVAASNPQSLHNYRTVPVHPQRLRHGTTVQMSSQGNAGASTSQPEQPVTLLPDGRLSKPTNLSLVVKDALRRWYLEAEKDALRGDVKAQALQGQMLIEGYGCDADPVRGKELAEKARRRGYRMQGVYCEI